MKKVLAGFTLIEVLVVIAIMGILASVVFVGMRPAGEQARDTQRQADLREVQTALELYRNRYGRYPEGCNAPGTWSGQADSNVACASASTPYILGNPGAGRPFAEFMTPLPRDPKLNGANSGYMYVTNTDGSVYKFMAKNTVEAEDGRIDYDHPFKSCDTTYRFASLPPSPDMRNYATTCVPENTIATNNRQYGCDIAMCDRIYRTSTANTLNYSNALESAVDITNLTLHCIDGHPQFETSYAVWGGIATPASTYSPLLERITSEAQTERIICTLP